MGCTGKGNCNPQHQQNPEVDRFFSYPPTDSDNPYQTSKMQGPKKNGCPFGSSGKQ